MRNKMLHCTLWRFAQGAKELLCMEPRLIVAYLLIALLASVVSWLFVRERRRRRERRHYGYRARRGPTSWV
jgi:hypothetical protein